MCSELDSEAVSSPRPVVPEDKHITFEEGTKDTMSESEDDDIGSEELMCNENIDVNDKESDDSDEEELTNRVFPQQKFSPVPFAARRSQTPDIGKIRYSPIAFPAKRAVTPNIYEQMIGKGHSRRLSDTGLSKAGSKMVDFGFREPKGLPHSNKSEGMASLNGQFVRPKLPTTKSHSPGLTVSGYFQPTGSVFRPSQPSSSSTTSKFPQVSSGSGSKIVGSSTDSSFSQPALFPGHSNRLSSGVNIPSTSSLTSNPGLASQGKSMSSQFKGSGHGGLMVSTNHDIKVAESHPVSSIAFQNQREGALSNARQLATTASLSNTVPVVSQMAWPTAPVPTSLAPLTVSVAVHPTPRFQPSVKSTHALSPGAKGVQLKPIAPLLSPPLMATSASGLNNGEMTGTRKLLAKKPAPLSGLVVADAKQGFPLHGGVRYFNASPIALSANQSSVSSLQSPTKPKQGPSSIPAHLSPKPPLSPRPPVLNTTPLSPRGANFFGTPHSNTDKVVVSAAPPRNASHTGIPSSNRYPIKSEGTPAHPSSDQTVACPVDAQAAQNMASNVNNDSKGQLNSKSILKRFIADGMEE